MLIDRGQSLIVIIDMQERLLPAVANHRAVLARAVLLLQATRRMDIPILVSEHYARGIGATHPEIAVLLPANSIMEKIHFSCLAEESCRRRIEATARRQVILAGTEAHVCVQQTAIELKQADYDVFVVADATASRSEQDRALSLARMQSAGIVIVSSEMVLFEWMRRADTTLFKEMLALIKDCDSGQ